MADKTQKKSAASKSSSSSKPKQTQARSEPVPDPTAPSPEHAKAVDTLGAAVEKADGVIGHSEILAVVNRKLIDLQGQRDVLV